MGDSPILAVMEFSAVNTCLGFLSESWQHSSSKITISPAGFHKAVQSCCSMFDLVLQNNTRECRAQEWRYFTLMSVFSSLSGMLSLLSLYLYFKIHTYIKKKRGLEKEKRVFWQGQSTWAAACVGGRRRMDLVFPDPTVLQTPSSKGKKKGKGKKVEDTLGEVPTASTLTWKPGMPRASYQGAGFPYSMPNIVDVDESEFE